MLFVSPFPNWYGSRAFEPGSELEPLLRLPMPLVILRILVPAPPLYVALTG